MQERRNSARIAFDLKVRETNGDYFYAYSAANLSEEGLFLLNKVCYSSQEPYSKLSFTLPNGVQFRNVTARIVREDRKGGPKGCAYEFLNLTEIDRMELKRFFHERVAS